LAPGAPLAGAGNNNRVARGGSWNAPADECRAAYRLKRDGNAARNDIGFRICVEQ
jgi:formylglycine-generating enzyme required for sulfatase activity